MNNEKLDYSAMYKGYIGESEFDQHIVDNLKSANFDDLKDVSKKLGYAISPYVLIRLADAYSIGGKNLNDKIEYLLTDCNFHSECDMLVEKQIDELKNDCKEQIERYAENDVLGYFEESYVELKDKGYVDLEDNFCDNISDAEFNYLQAKGYIEPYKNGYALTDDYVEQIKLDQDQLLENDL